MAHRILVLERRAAERKQAQAGLLETTAKTLRLVERDLFAGGGDDTAVDTANRQADELRTDDRASPESFGHPDSLTPTAERDLERARRHAIDLQRQLAVRRQNRARADAPRAGDDGDQEARAGTEKGGEQEAAAEGGGAGDDDALTKALDRALRRTKE